MKEDPKIASLRKHASIHAGNIYAVTDEHSHEVGYCVVTHATKGPIQLGFFFDNRETSIDSLISNSKEIFLEAVLVCLFGYISIRDGHWRLVGQVKGFKTGDWPIAVGVWGQGGRPPYYACYFEPKKLAGWTTTPISAQYFDQNKTVLISTDLSGAISVVNRLKKRIAKKSKAFMQCDF
jgi:hypothetical protein